VITLRKEYAGDKEQDVDSSDENEEHVRGDEQFITYVFGHILRRGCWDLFLDDNCHDDVS
jgi:hypothetical protein